MTQTNIITMNDVEAQSVRWLWHPYIPYGKVTLVQGDPGDGKTTLVLAVASLLTNGEPMPTESLPAEEKKNVIYQTAEDGLADTIKPRLEMLRADCSRVHVIDESETPLSFSDSRIEEAIIRTAAGLLILDPLQAYLGGDVDMHRANETRTRFASLTGVAERTGCAVVLVGHMNKMSGAKSLYRGLGSIDIAANARSILLVGRGSNDAPTVRVMAHLKSNLAPEGRSVMFELDGGFRWLGVCDLTADDILGGQTHFRQPKMSLAMGLITEKMQGGEQPAQEMFGFLSESGIGKRTAQEAKRAMGIASRKTDAGWVWTQP